MMMAQTQEAQPGDFITYEAPLTPPPPQPLIETRQVRWVTYEGDVARYYLVAVDPQTIDERGGNHCLLSIPRRCIRRVSREIPTLLL